MSGRITVTMEVLAMVMMMLVVSTIEIQQVNAQMLQTPDLSQQIATVNRRGGYIMNQIEEANFVTMKGLVKNIIVQIIPLKATAKVLGGTAITTMTNVENALIAKINATEPSNFTEEERAYVSAWVNVVMEYRQNHPNYASQILPGFG